MTRTIEEYVTILKAVLNLQISYIVDDPNYGLDSKLEGEEIGLRIALQKIDESEFLYNPNV